MAGGACPARAGSVGERRNRPHRRSRVRGNRCNRHRSACHLIRRMIRRPRRPSTTAMASYPSTSPQGDKPSGYGPAAPGSGGGASGIQTAAATGGYATGPYGTGGSGSAMTQTQQGFYRTSTPDSGGPVASTADARRLCPGYAPATLTTPNSGYPAPSNYGATPYGADAAHTRRQLCTGDDAGHGLRTADYGTADYGYPAPASSGANSAIPPTAAYPTTGAGNGYPVTRPDLIAPQGANGGYPAAATAPPTYGATTLSRSAHRPMETLQRTEPHRNTARTGRTTAAMDRLLAALAHRDREPIRTDIGRAAPAATTAC